MSDFLMYEESESVCRIRNVRFDSVDGARLSCDKT